MTLVYRVPGISCDHCKNAIEGEVRKLSDVRRVEVDVAKRRVVVTGEVDDAAVRTAIDEAGYDVASMSEG